MKREIDIEIDYIKKSDLKDVVWIEKKSFKNPWRENAFKREIENDNEFSHIIVARNNNRTIAFIGFTCVLDEAHILTFAVHPKFRRRGIGTQLFIYALNMVKSIGAKKVTLEVRISNIPAKSLYKKLGFQIVAMRRKFYPDGEDGYIMCIPNINEMHYTNNGYFNNLSKRKKNGEPRN